VLSDQKISTEDSHVLSGQKALTEDSHVLSVKRKENKAQARSKHMKGSKERYLLGQNTTSVVSSNKTTLNS